MILPIVLGLAVLASRPEVEASGVSKILVYLVALILAVSTVVLPPAAPYNHFYCFRACWFCFEIGPIFGLGKSYRRSLASRHGSDLMAMDCRDWLVTSSFFVPVRDWALPFYASLIVPLSVTALLILRGRVKHGLKQTTCRVSFAAIPSAIHSKAAITTTDNCK